MRGDVATGGSPRASHKGDVLPCSAFLGQHARHEQRAKHMESSPFCQGKRQRWRAFYESLTSPLLLSLSCFLSFSVPLALIHQVGSSTDNRPIVTLWSHRQNDLRPPRSPRAAASSRSGSSGASSRRSSGSAPSYDHCSRFADRSDTIESARTKHHQLN